jgi:hypothetical protein
MSCHKLVFLIPAKISLRFRVTKYLASGLTKIRPTVIVIELRESYIGHSRLNFPGLEGNCKPCIKFCSNIIPDVFFEVGVPVRVALKRRLIQNKSRYSSEAALTMMIEYVTNVKYIWIDQTHTYVHIHILI